MLSNPDSKKHIFHFAFYAMPWRHRRAWLIRKAGDGPLVLLPLLWRNRLRQAWKRGVIDALDSGVLLPWAAFRAGLLRPPERLMTADERHQAQNALSTIRLNQRWPERIQLRDKWAHVWALAQIAADRRAQACTADLDREAD